MGGLGNMMFQVAALESLARGKVAYQGWPTKYHEIFQGFKPSTEKFKFEQAKTLTFEFGYEPLEYVEGAIYSGYFQSWKYLDRPLIEQLFSWSDSTLQQVNELEFDPTDACAVHVRRGDYLNYPLIHPTLEASYYYNAVEELSPKKVVAL